MDAIHFILGAILGMIRCFIRPYIRTSPGRQRYSMLGALRSHSKELISVRTAGNIDSSSLCELFYEIRKKHPSGKITLVIDSARYHEDFAAFTSAINDCLDSIDTTLRDETLSLLVLNFQFFPKRQT